MEVMQGELTAGPLISIIVPIYKVETFLPRCIDSILKQTYTNIEVLLVDDGSPDRCGEIADEYAAKDSRVQVIHQENGGIAKARNAGIHRSKGEYLYFVDSDDYIAEDAIETLYRMIVEQDAELAIANYAYTDEEGNLLPADHFPKSNPPIHDGVLSGREVLEELAITGTWHYSVLAWNRLGHRKLYRAVEFTEGRTHEDELIVHRLIAQCERVALSTKVTYYYVQRSGSIMHVTNPQRHLDAVCAYLDRAQWANNLEIPKLAVVSLRQAVGYFCEAIDIIQDASYGEQLKELHREFSHVYGDFMDYYGVHGGNVGFVDMRLFELFEFNPIWCKGLLKFLKPDLFR